MLQGLNHRDSVKTQLGLLPVSGNVDLGDLEVELGHSSDGNAVTSCGEVQQLLLQLQGEGQHHVPETPEGAGRGVSEHTCEDQRANTSDCDLLPSVKMAASLRISATGPQ